MYGLLALGMSLWNQLVLPVLFMCFWLVLFALQIYTYFSSRDKPTSRERLLFLFLTRWDRALLPRTLETLFPSLVESKKLETQVDLFCLNFCTTQHYVI